MGKEILSILCPTCNAPAKYDIVHQNYHCGHCGNKIILGEVLEARKQYQENQKRKLKEYTKDYSLMSATCKGCGASVVFEEGEALSKCQFCGSSVVRKKYIYDDRFPENIIPFGVTLDEAKEKIRKWCGDNKSKKEARKLKKHVDELKGFYLPYEMISGPVSCQVKRIDDINKYKAIGYVENGFINCSNQLDNLVLDAMEPYDLSELDEFNFGYVAGHHVKISDIEKEEEKKRINNEVQQNYRDWMNEIYNTKAVSLETEFRQDVRVPVLLPAYYINTDGLCAAVNGQTGKVSVKALKDSHFITPPWWIKSLLIIFAYVLLAYGIILFGSKSTEIALYCAGGYMLFELFLFAFMIQDSYYHSGTFTSYRKIFTSGDKLSKRENGSLVDREDLNEKIEEPMFERELGKDKKEKVYYRFCPPGRMTKMVLTSLIITLFPILAALVINGFNFNRLDVKASGIWFLITFIVVPVYLIRGAVQWLYESPYIYDRDKNGKLKRRTLLDKWRKLDGREKWENIKFVIGALVVPPISLIVWFVIFIIAASVYFTAFGL